MTKFHLLCPIEWNPNDDNNYQQIMANIISLHHMARLIHGKSVTQVQKALLAKINERLQASIASGEQSWTAPLLETSRHMRQWNTIVVAATQNKPTLPDGKVLKWLGSIRFMKIIEQGSILHDVADDDQTYLLYNQPDYRVSDENYGHAINEYNTVSAYASWEAAAQQNHFKRAYGPEGKILL